MAMITKTERVVLVATKTQLASWKLAADQVGVSLSELVRQSMERRVRELASAHGLVERTS